MSGDTALRYLYCDTNQLTSLDVSGCVSLERLYCDGNQLASLDVSGLKELFGLNCANNELTAINVKGCEELRRGDCRNNHLPLSMLTPLPERMYKAPQVIRGIELQALSPWDLSAEMLIEGKKTDIHCDKADCYVFGADSTQLIFYPGAYQVTLENENVYECVYAGGAFWNYECVPVPVLYEVTVRPVDFVPAPVFSEYKEVFQGYVSISCPIAKAEIYYTDDGSEPTINSALYTKAIPMDRNMTIKAIAVFDDVVSQVATYEVKIVEAPVFSMPSGAVRRGAMVAISCAEADAKIYYKIDAGSLGNLYTEPIRIDRAMTLRAWAVKEGRESQEVTATYTIDNTPNEPALSASTLRVYAQDGTIYLSEPTGEVEVFTTSGRRVYRGVSTAIPVPRPGVYVVTAAGQKYKVGVK
ncbi:MAG: chitobiase/beta-hexosaminidase C-terminal domain-containing protein [Bacteroidales bacterium]|nr:chitobiase/beta-hexosaminidase C-terminal domain-containing protein [Bacteroidales bacterium]